MGIPKDDEATTIALEAIRDAAPGLLRVYSLSDEHYEWADTEEFTAEAPRVPDALKPVFPDGETVEELGELLVYIIGTKPTFGSLEAVEATPQEMAAWRAQWALVEEAQQAFRARLEEAATAYETAAKEALADLAEATKPWAPVEADLKARSVALAAKLHEHRTAAKEWEKAREEKQQAHLDTIHGPRALVLYKPESLSSRRQADHIARVHLVTCSRRAAKNQASWVSPPPWDNDEGLRANDAWERLTRPEEWIRGLWGDLAKNLRVKFCSSCKPWEVFQEHLDEEPFPRPLYHQGDFYLGNIRLTDLPGAWAANLKQED